MAASAKTLTLDNRIQTGDWTIVLPRRGRRRSNFPKVRTPDQQQQPWVPTDILTDPCRQSRLIQKMEICVKKIETSQFYQTFLAQIQTPEIFDCFCRVLGSEMKMQMVIYGIGSIESYETPQFQLGLAILLKRKFSWIGEIEVFDPILSATESLVLESFGCSVLSVNEQGRRHVKKPTLFYMPHCEAGLYDNLLHANWGVESMNRIVLFGNSFEMYRQYAEFKNSAVADSAKHVLAVHRITKEFQIMTVSDDYFAAFHDSSWHFFSPDPESELQFIKI
ncbi:SRR1 domain-containing protein [Cephalotus follicularis]|uniref:SRR1 domain-containing protein n=1 Tax=Cephalotus follicularis TaxID=3775 RepID=A0A1Q3CJM4_CEPFO|nr:SRR1 domain-containing protein [Cephalotus follicularis]